MRQIEKQMLHAVINRNNWKKDNTEVVNEGGVISVYLHGNKIFALTSIGAMYSFAGWDTVTTRSRLRALGLPIVSKDGSRYAYGNELSTKRGDWFCTSLADFMSYAATK